MKQIIVFCSLLIINLTISAQSNYAQYVNPFIGTGGHGHTFPGATVPFGMVQLSPDTRIDGTWDGCSGYHQSDSIIYGFSHTHLSGTGCSDYGDIMLMPTYNQTGVIPKNYAANYTHNNEKASAGFYAVALNNGVNVELTSTTRVGMHKYVFTKNESKQVVLDLQHRDKLLEGSIKIVNDHTVEGIRRSEAWATNQTVFYRIEFSKPFSNKTILSGDNNDLSAIFNFDLKANEALFVKVALSNVSTDGAAKNMQAELPDFNFEKVKKDAETLWNKELAKIEVKTNDVDKLKIFYTALYHTMIQPNVNMDVDGMYRGMDNKIHKAEGFMYYSVFSLWDTFRAAHPLYTIIDRKRSLDFINTFLAHYQQGGRLPVWELASNETDCMIGYHSVSVIADATLKGINNYDTKLAFEAMKKSATWNHLGLPAYMNHGYLALEDEHESVSKTLEYAYDDWCIAQMAKLLNSKDDYDNYMQRSQYWKNVFDVETNFMRPKKNGGWLKPFEPREVNNNFTEGNSWQYSFFVPQDINGLIEKMGGAQNFEAKLDKLFSTTSQTTGREQADITGLIGQYAHGNEPSHHMAYLYNYIGKPYKTQFMIHKICSEFYKAAPDGLIGNEDCGQMSAWYVLSSLGFYQVTPGTNLFMIGTPNFDEAKINLENGKSFTIKASNLSNANYYIQSMKLNDKAFFDSYIDYAALINGGTISFEMGNTIGKIPFTIPQAEIIKNTITEVPTIEAASRIFKNKLLITIKSANPNYRIFYTTDGSKPTTKSTLYTSPFEIDKTTTIQAIALGEYNKLSFATSGTFNKMPHNWKINLHSKYNPQYTAGGDEGLIDGIRGDVNWRKGEWQGYQSQNFECVIDFDKKETINAISGGYLQDSRSWILMPTKVEYYVSDDNKKFKLIGTVDNTVKPEDNENKIAVFKLNLAKPIDAKFLKVKAYNFGALPSWHQGVGGDAFIFVDEIIVE